MDHALKITTAYLQMIDAWQNLLQSHGQSAVRQLQKPFVKDSVAATLRAASR